MSLGVRREVVLNRYRRKPLGETDVVLLASVVWEVRGAPRSELSSSSDLSSELLDR